MSTLTQDRSAVFAKQRELWKAQEKAGPTVKSRRNRKWLEDEPELQRMWSEGLEVQDIADALGRTATGVKLHAGRNRERLGLALRPSHGRPRTKGTSKILAKLLGISAQLVSDYARGRRAQPPLELLERMNGLLGATMVVRSRHTTLRRPGMESITIPHRVVS